MDSTHRGAVAVAGPCADHAAVTGVRVKGTGWRHPYDRCDTNDPVFVRAGELKAGRG